MPRGPLCVYSLAKCHGYTQTQALTSGCALWQEAPLLVFPSRPGGCVSFSPAHGAVCRGDPEAHSRSVWPPHPPAGIRDSYSRALVSAFYWSDLKGEGLAPFSSSFFAHTANSMRSSEFPTLKQ